MKKDVLAHASAFLAISLLQGCGGGGGGGGGGVGALAPLPAPAATASAMPPHAPAGSPGSASDPAPTTNGSTPTTEYPAPTTGEPAATPTGTASPMMKYSYKLGAPGPEGDPYAVLAELQLPEYAGFRPYRRTIPAFSSPSAPVYRAVSLLPELDLELVPTSGATSSTVKYWGQRGYQSVGVFLNAGGISEIYARPKSSEVRFEFIEPEIDPLGKTSSVDLIAKLNSLGEQGYCDWILPGLIRREIPRVGTCEYDVQPQALGFENYLAQLKAQGSKG